MTTSTTDAGAVVPSGNLLAPDIQRTWDDLVDMCKRGGWSSINVASKQRMAAILAVDSALRANAGGESGVEDELGYT